MQCAVCIGRDFMDHGLGLGSGAVSLQYSFTVRKWCLCLGKTSICFKARYHGLLLLNVDFQNLMVLYNTCFLGWGMSSHRTYNANRLQYPFTRHWLLNCNWAWFWHGSGGQVSCKKCELVDKVWVCGEILLTIAYFPGCISKIAECPFPCWLWWWLCQSVWYS